MKDFGKQDFFKKTKKCNARLSFSCVKLGINNNFHFFFFWGGGGGGDYLLGLALT